MSEPRNYAKLRELLISQETFPLRYLHKFIGRKTEEFAAGVAWLEGQFPTLEKQSERPSADDRHVALTYAFMAANADEVIMLIEATHHVADVRVVL